MKFSNEYDLQLDLAKFLRECGYLTFTEIEIKGGRGGRADVVAVKPSYANKDCRIYEVKNNRYSFEKDLKYTKYLDVCHRMYIACPKGLIDKNEVDPRVGLIYRNENGWYTVKAAKRNHPKDFNIDFVLSLLYRGYEETLQQRRLRDRIIAEDNATLKEQAYKIGYEIARRLDRDKETQVEAWVKEVGDLFKKYLNIEPGLFSTEGLPSTWEIESILSAVSGTLKEVNNIRQIGDYLRNLDLPEESENGRMNLKEYRERAFKGIQKAMEVGQVEKLSIDKR